MAYEFRLPDIGEGLHEAEILQWYINEGDVINAEDAIAEVQTDKAAVELTSPVGGKVLSVCGPAGSTVKVGERVIALDTSAVSAARETTAAETQTASRGESSAAQTSETSALPMTGPGQASSAAASADGAAARVQASPAVRKLARDLGVDLRAVVPTGVKGRLTRSDVRQAAEQKSTQGTAANTAADTVLPLPQAQDPKQPMQPVRGGSNAASATAETRRESIRGLRKRVYENMTKSMYTAPQVTGMDDLDATGLVHLRQRLLPFAEARGIKLTYLPVIIKAVTHVLREHPIFNASVDDESMEIVYKQPIHIGIATATQGGLIVPVIRDADSKSVFTIAAELQDLTERGRHQQLKLHELRGSTFTITSTGAHGGWFATPIVNYPEVAILGVHSIVKKAVVLEDDSIVPQHRMGFSLTFDHRVIDGEPAGKFMYLLKQYVENPEAMLAL